MKMAIDAGAHHTAPRPLCVTQSRIGDTVADRCAEAPAPPLAIEPADPQAPRIRVPIRG
ncbi:MAG: hypothetical protein ABTQ31_19695 [Rhizobiaceae bacterium]